MAASRIHDLYDNKTLYMIAGSTEYFRLTLKNAVTNEPIDLTSLENIEWFFTTYSVREKEALIYKSAKNKDILILQDSQKEFTNTIQVTLLSSDTINLQGAFVHQIVLTDGMGVKFTPFQGLIVIDRGITR